MLSAFLTGFFLGLSLIVAIGAQNIFVLRQGVLRQHIFYVALFCALSDAFLICIGIVGISFFFNNFVNQFADLLLGFSSIWLASYGAVRLISAFKSNSTIQIETSTPKSLLPTLTILTVLTFANPHVYLDTIVLIGSISQQFPGNIKLAYAIGASLASFVFFFSLAYGAKFLAPIMQKPIAWRILDSFIALVMFSLAIKIAHSVGWF